MNTPIPIQDEPTLTDGEHILFELRQLLDDANSQQRIDGLLSSETNQRALKLVALHRPSALRGVLADARDANRSEVAARLESICWDLPKPIGNGAMDRSLESTKRRMNGKERPVTLPWGDMLRVWDGKGWFQGVYVVIGSTGTGKTQFVTQLMLHAARDGVECVYVALEMQIDGQWSHRLISSQTGVHWARYHYGTLTHKQLEESHKAKEQLAKLPIRGYQSFDFTSGKLIQLCQQMRDHIGPNKPLLIVIDYLQLVSTNGETRDGIKGFITACHQCAVESNAVLLVVSSTGRQQYALTGKAAIAKAGMKIQKTELPGCTPYYEGSIEKVDVLLGLGKEAGEIEYSASGQMVLVGLDNDRKQRKVALVVSKHRTGRTQWIPLHFIDGYRYESAQWEDFEELIEKESTKTDKPRQRLQAIDQVENWIREHQGQWFTWADLSAYFTKLENPLSRPTITGHIRTVGSRLGSGFEEKNGRGKQTKWRFVEGCEA